MKMEVQTLDSLREIIRKLESENISLKKQLADAELHYESHNPFDSAAEEHEEYDPDQGARILREYITEEHARLFFKMFWGRQDVYAKRGKKGGYFPQCKNRWNNFCPKQHGIKQVCDSCEHRKWIPVSPNLIIKHLIGSNDDGSDVVGIYPLFSDGTCRFIVFDFDNHEKGSAANDYANEGYAWQKEVDALRIMCEGNGIKPLVERSRSGRGAHVWILFSQAIPATLARNFGSMLLDKGSESVNLTTFHYYDRMYPSQDSSDYLGSLIALPLQGAALRDGNSAFVDENWNAYPNQWEILKHKTCRLSKDAVENYILKWKSELNNFCPDYVNRMDSRPKPWRRNITFSKDDVVGKINIVLADGIYIDSLNLLPRLQNQIRSLAAFDNPIYYKNKRLGYSNYYNYSSVYLGKDIDGYIRIPRGLQDRLESLCKAAGIEYVISDKREKGRPIRVDFNGTLKQQQDLAAQRMLEYDNGVLSAATAFGKTVVCSYLIGERKVNTLILVNSRDLLEQWVEELGKFLIIKEEPPTYTTKTGRIKQRDSVIGVLHGSKKALTGIVDVAMIGSACSDEQLEEISEKYGMVIFDECHHAAASSAVDILDGIKARFVYGVSATVKRSDDLERIVLMMIGPMRFKYSAKERAEQQNIGRIVIPRYTRAVDTPESRENISTAFAIISEDADRDEMIIADAKASIAEHRTPVILTRQKLQAGNLYEKLKDCADCVYLIYGNNSDKENSEITRQLKSTPEDKSLILIATGQKIGEGFDFPRLDTLLLAAPVSFAGRLSQYIGRLSRDYEGKTEIRVYDYVDSHIRYFNNMFNKRLRTYKANGFDIGRDSTKEKQLANAIYDGANYIDVFERDIIEAEKSIIISSPEMTRNKVERFILLTKPVLERGVRILVITGNPDESLRASSSYYLELISMMSNVGINVISMDIIDEHCAIIDKDLVWHGGVNILGDEDIWDNLIRIKSLPVASELLEILLGSDEWEKWTAETI